MISLLQISESAQGLVLSYPVWTAIALLAATFLLTAYAVVARARIQRRWPVSLAIVFAAWAGIYVATFRTTIGIDTGSVYAFLRYDHTVQWKDAADIYLEQHGGDWRIVVLDRHRRAFDFDVAELSVEDRDRLMAYMVDRMPASAFGRPAELMKRHAPSATRAVGFLGDQQI